MYGGCPLVWGFAGPFLLDFFVEHSPRYSSKELQISTGRDWPRAKSTEKIKQRQMAQLRKGKKVQNKNEGNEKITMKYLSRQNTPICKKPPLNKEECWTTWYVRNQIIVNEFKIEKSQWRCTKFPDNNWTRTIEWINNCFLFLFQYCSRLSVLIIILLLEKILAKQNEQKH